MAPRGSDTDPDSLPSFPLSSSWLDESLEAGAPRRRMPLSRKERLVLIEIARGRETDQIASKLYLSPHTVRTHTKNLMRKLSARTRAQAVAIAMSEGMIDL
jgi:DNA-binding NarL/FixJ family response regulator